MKINKKYLRLKEDINDSSTQKIQKAITNAKQNPSGKDTEALSDLSNSKTDDTTTTFKVSANDPQAQSKITRIASQGGNLGINNVEITDSVQKNGQIVESIQFTKGELSEFLKSL